MELNYSECRTIYQLNLAKVIFGYLAVGKISIQQNEPASSAQMEEVTATHSDGRSMLHHPLVDISIYPMSHCTDA